MTSVQSSRSVRAMIELLNTQEVAAAVGRHPVTEVMTDRPRTGPVLTTRQAAVYCGLAPQTLRNLLSAGDGPRVWKHGRLNVFFTEDLDAWLIPRLVLGSETQRALVSVEEEA